MLWCLDGSIVKQRTGPVHFHSQRGSGKPITFRHLEEILVRHSMFVSQSVSILRWFGSLTRLTLCVEPEEGQMGREWTLGRSRRGQLDERHERGVVLATSRKP